MARGYALVPFELLNLEKVPVELALRRVSRTQRWKVICLLLDIRAVRVMYGPEAIPPSYFIFAGGKLCFRRQSHYLHKYP